MNSNSSTLQTNKILERTKLALKALRAYHRHEVWGLGYLPKDGPAIIATNHSLATYDGLLLGQAIFERTGRLTKGLGDRRLFEIPLTRKIVSEVGLVNAGPQVARELLEQGHLVAVAPGGMREALRGADKRYEIQWADRMGFARLACESQTPLILAACPGADDIFRVYSSKLQSVIYKNWHLPLPLFRGLGPTLIPRPVKLAHHLSAPLIPPKHYLQAGPEERDRLVAQFHREAIRSMHHLMSKALKAR